jgi:DNA-binding PucR family transcriptional regulator
MASHPQEVRSFFDDTVAPLVAYDEQYATDLVGTLDSYLANNCNMNATAQAIHAHAGWTRCGVRIGSGWGWG